MSVESGSRICREKANYNFEKDGGGLSGTEEAFWLPTQQLWVRILVPLRFLLFSG